MMALTPNQEEAVNSAHEPLFIQAGAGTGKTFTLTKRIAHGLGKESGPLIGGVDRLLTITFTNKAAGELIGRVRAELRAQGLAEESLKIDAAWISTIHSMCRRILLSHAFDIGMDPGASLLTQDETSALSSLALDELLLERADDLRLMALFDSFDVEGTTALIASMSALLELAPGGVDGFDMGPAPVSIEKGRQMVLNVLAAYQGALAELGAAGIPLEKPSYKKKHEDMESSIAALEEWVAAKGDTGTWREIDALLDSIPLVKGGNLGNPFKDIFNECKGVMLEAKAAAQSAVSHELLQSITSLSQEHLAKHRALKQARGALDTNDLLIATYELLSSIPSVSSLYQEKFDSVMVDEFQDTDDLQVGIVRQLCDEELSTLATVGDAQQSIYGFRGADLEVYQDTRALMQSHGSREVELATNYRSQADILRFVEDIFSTNEFFGQGFLKVDSGRKADTDPDWLHADDSRVKILLSAGTKEGRSATPVARLRQADARALASEFERLHAQGASYGDMAILMQSTKSARSGPYLHELRRRGIPCIIAGGSDFYSLPEVTIISMLLRVLADRDDDEALFELLGSSALNICDDDLLTLSVAVKQRLKLLPEEARAKVSLYDAVRFCVGDEETQVSPELSFALEVLDKAIASSRQEPLAQVVRSFVEHSGWKATLQLDGIEGGAIYANIERMHDMIDDFERLNGRSLFAASQYFREMIELASEGSGARAKPGTLVSSGSDAVRIMTIHSSKGLEFPIVAVAEYEKSAHGSGGLISLTEHGSRYLALAPSGSGDASSYITKEAADPESFAAAQDTTAFRTHAVRLNNEREAAEQQRLFYVALTRARDQLIVVSHDSSFASKGELSNGLTRDFMQAVFGEELPSEHTVMKTNAGALVELCVNVVPFGEQEEEEAREEDASLLVSHALPVASKAPYISSAPIQRKSIFSYSSIAKHDDESVAKGDPVAASIRLRDRSQDAETVSPVGSAFHLVAQWLAIAPRTHQAEIEHHLLTAAHRYDLSEEEALRLVNAVAAWVSSQLYAKTREYARRYAEHAFCVDVQGVPLEGYIDLLCLDDEGGALVVDYKTGTSGQGEDLHGRYSLQAHCYAYALLSTETCRHLEMVFVRPEANIEEVTFSFDAEDLPMLARRIIG